MSSSSETTPAAAEELWLEGVWTFYFHDPDDNNWTLESYKRLGDVSSVEEMWNVLRATTKLCQAGMFFVMREHVFPCWDDPNNIDGGCVSIKVPVVAVPATWEYLVKRTLGETLVADKKKWESLNGISVSPKRGFCIFKLWMADAQNADPSGWVRQDFLLPSEYKGEVVFRLNRENMQMDAHKLAANLPLAKDSDGTPPMDSRNDAPRARRFE